jgi:uncharacterized phiE125 gp8 family phage protein
MAAVDLVTLAEVKAQLEVTTSGDDALLGALITAASRAIARRYVREFAPKTASQTRRFRVEGRLVDLAPHDLRSASSVTLHPESGSPMALVADQDYALEPLGGSLGGSYLRLRLSTRTSLASAFADAFGFAQLDIAGAWGLFDTVEVPEDIKRACIVTVGAWSDRAVAQYAIEADAGWEIRPDRASTWAIPSAAHRLLEPWARVTV